MLDVVQHMHLLVKQAQIKNEQPQDGSFLPLSLVVASMLRQLPRGLGPPAGLLSFHQIDRFPIEMLHARMQNLQMLKPVQFEQLVQSLVLYTKLVRALLLVCQQHLMQVTTTDQAVESIVASVATALQPPPSEPEPVDHKPKTKTKTKTKTKPKPKPKTSATHKVIKKTKPETPTSDGSESISEQEDRLSADPTRPVTAAPIPVVAPPCNSKETVEDAAAAMERAELRDKGDGQVVSQLMRRFPHDFKLQRLGLRALRKLLSTSSRLPSAATAAASSSSSSSSSSDDNEGNKRVKAKRQPVDQLDAREQHQHDDEKRLVVLATIFQALQRGEEQGDTRCVQHALECCATWIKSRPRDDQNGLERRQSESEVANLRVLSATGALGAILSALTTFPLDEKIQMTALGILAHPSLADPAVLRVHPVESARVVMDAMKRFDGRERIQGLGCLALANLSQRDANSLETIVASGALALAASGMKRFATSAVVQAAGCWLFGLVASQSPPMLQAALDADGLPLCEKARRHFLEDATLQQQATFAIQQLTRERSNEQDGDQVEGVASHQDDSNSPPSECVLQ